MTTFTYWKPEPKRRGFMWWALLLPAIAYSLGVIVYARAAFAPDAIAANGHLYGSAFMVVGGEAGTLAAASEVFRKHLTLDADGKRDTNPLDWLGLGVSLVATLGNLFVVYSALTMLEDVWVTWARSYGPVVLLLCSGLDFYATVMEFGFYNASFERRMDAWLLARHNAEMRWKREHAPAEQPHAPAEQPHARAEQSHERPDAKTCSAECPHCDWRGNGYADKRAARNALAAHMRFCEGGGSE